MPPHPYRGRIMMRPQDSTSRPSLRTSAPCAPGLAFETGHGSIRRSRCLSITPLNGVAMSGRELFKVYVLGRFRLLAGETPIAISSRLRKPQELLQTLIAFGGIEVSSGALIDALWPDSEGDAAYHALESTLHRLRQLLGARDAILMEGSKVSLNRDQWWVDMWEFEDELQRPHDPDANCIETIARLRRLYQGHFLQHE